MSEPTTTYDLRPTKYLVTIGIECHVQLKTKTKLFAAVDNDARDAEPNTKVSPICFGLPGTLPYLNEKAVEYAIRAGLALNVDPQPYSIFERKHYFYPDLPMGYQITQLEKPIVKGGYVEIKVGSETKQVQINRVQLEADAGKSIHPAGVDYTLVDLNRAGTPLLEIVSEPDMHSPEEAKAYVRELYLLMKYSGVSDVDLYHGNMRFDVNLSLALEGSDELGTRTETKNLNSFKAVERAAAYEIKRQTELLERGEKIIQETRGWDEAKQKTVSQRSKEEAHDYRYFPDPDIPPVEISVEQVERVRGEMPLLPSSLRQLFTANGIEQQKVETLLEHQSVMDAVREVWDLTHDKSILTTVINLLITYELAKINNSVNPGAMDAGKMPSTQRLIEISKLFLQNMISSTGAKSLYDRLRLKDEGMELKELANKLQLIQVSDSGELEKLVEQVITENPQAVEDFKAGEEKAIGFLTGQIMKLSRGQANPQKVQELIKQKLN